MRIGIDARGIYKELDGIGRFGTNLLKELAKLDNFNEYIVYKNPSIESIVNKSNFIEKVIDVPRFTVREQIVMPEILRKDELDIFHCLHNILPVFYPKKSIVTIHDIMATRFLWFYEAFCWVKKYTGLFYFKLFVKLSVGKTSKIMVPSKFTKKEVIRYLNVKNEKIQICGEAVDNAFKPFNDKALLNNILEKYGVCNPFILHTSNLKPYKNLRNLIYAYKLLSQKKNNYPELVIAGHHKKYTPQIKKFTEKLGLKEKINFVGYVGKNDLPVLMSGSLCFIFPSIYEGFGLPILEAMACGTPVITSNLSSLPEVAGDAAILVNPYDIREIANAMEKVLIHKKFREELVSKGFERVKLFSWEKCARETLEVYEEIYNEKRKDAS